MEPAQVLDFGRDRQCESAANNGKRFREMMHRELDDFLDQIIDTFKDKGRPTLGDLSEMLMKTRREFLGSCLQHMIEEKYSEGALPVFHVPC